MDRKRMIYGALVGAGILLVSSFALCPGKKQEKTESSVEPLFIENLDKPIQPHVYTVKNGDYLSKIIYNELGLRGRDIYTRCFEIQEANNLGSERDVSMVVNGELVSGKDSLVDLIYPGERLNLD